MAKDVNELVVYQESLRLIKNLYELLSQLSGSERDLEMQLKRAAKSIPANIAEGFAKKSSYKEFRRYLLISLASSDEVQAHLQVLNIVQPRLKIQTNSISLDFKILSKRLNSLHKNWRYTDLRKPADILNS